MNSEFQSSMPLPPAHYTLIDPANPTALPPPPIPTEKTIHVFGVPIHETYRQQLENLEKGIQKLYPDANFNHKEELKKLNISLLFNYFELIDILIKNPPLYQKKLEEIKTILINMHHLMNAYRPHQARQILIEMLQSQIQRRQLLLNSIDAKMNEVRQLLSTVTSELKKTTASSFALSLQKISSEIASSLFNNKEYKSLFPSQYEEKGVSVNTESPAVTMEHSTGSVPAKEENISNNINFQYEGIEDSEERIRIPQIPHNYLKMKRILDQIDRKSVV